jgi:glutamine cyclotransferase
MCRRFLAGVLGVSLLFSCNEEEKIEDGPIVATSYISTVELPENGKAFASGDKIPFKINYSDSGKTFEGITVLIDGKQIFESAEKKASITFDYASDTLKLGMHKIRVESKINDGSEETLDLESVEYDFMLLAKEAPELYSFSVKKKYPHDPQAYTQGLFFEGGMLFEGTGLEGKSTLRLVDYKANKIVQSVGLDRVYFGEGIAAVGDEIYQLTYTSRKGFVYDKKTFKQKREFTYSTQGWGLTYDGTYLVLSDGSSNLYFYTPSDFKLHHQITVVDNVSDWAMLNELEFINGEIWANVYQTDLILRIDPKSGRVIARIDMSGLLTESEKSNVDVLNGIAYDEFSKTIFVTGKNWPWLFEIELTAKETAAVK